MSKLYTEGMPLDELNAKLRDVTRDTKATHEVHDMRYPAWGLGLHSFSPIAETQNIVAEAIMTVPPGGKPPQNGDVLVIPLKGQEKPALGIIFDPEPMGGDWIGDAYKVHVVQNSPKQAIGHEFNTQGKGAGAGRG